MTDDNDLPEPVYVGEGFCPICEAATIFTATHTWFRDSLKCVQCDSIPRERALIHVLGLTYPNWRELRIHESSPVFRGASLKLKNECAQYVHSQYDPELGFGKIGVGGYQSEDLEAQTFADDAFDIVITQDVLEHLFDPIQATREIMRTLKPGGAHVFSVPIVRKQLPSRRRAKRDGDKIIHLLEPEYHGNPMSSGGALVTMDWGYDILNFLSTVGLAHTMFYIDDLRLGIRAEYVEILMGRKGPQLGLPETLE